MEITLSFEQSVKADVKEEQIPLGARILAVSDAFDAMTTNRSYRQRLSINRAVKELLQHSGTQFDPIVVQGFLNILRKEEIWVDSETISWVKDTPPLYRSRDYSLSH